MKKIDLRKIKFRSDEYREGFLAGFKFFIIKEGTRHLSDLWQIQEDVRNLRDIKIPKQLLDLNAWYEIVPKKSTAVPKRGTYQKEGE